MAEHEASEWAGETGDRWREHIDRFEGMLTEIGAAAIDHADFQPGEKVADVGCGGGLTSLEVALRVGPEGSVTGIDIAPQLVAIATERAAASGLANIGFETLDCEAGTPTSAPFDRLFSRFGVMFFADTTTGFANMQRWLVPGGKLDFAAWAAPDRNPWFGTVGAVMARHFEMPQTEPDAPGPFRLADAVETGAKLEAAGFTDIRVSEHIADQPFGGPGATPDEAVDFVLRALGMQALLDEAEPDKQAAVKDELRAAFAAHQSEGAIMMQGCSLFYSGRAS